MSYSIRQLILVFILLVATPVQGIAETLMFACDVGQGRGPATSMHEHGANVSPHSHSDSIERLQAVPDQHSEADLVSLGSDDHHSSGSDSNHHLKHHSCCSSSASGVIGGTAVLSALPHINRTIFAYISSSHLPPVLAGLERPPRHSLV